MEEPVMPAEVDLPEATPLFDALREELQGVAPKVTPADPVRAEASKRPQSESSTAGLGHFDAQSGAFDFYQLALDIEGGSGEDQEAPRIPVVADDGWFAEDAFLLPPSPRQADPVGDDSAESLWLEPVSMEPFGPFEAGAYALYHVEGSRDAAARDDRANANPFLDAANPSARNPYLAEATDASTWQTEAKSGTSLARMPSPDLSAWSSLDESGEETQDEEVSASAAGAPSAASDTLGSWERR